MQKYVKLVEQTLSEAEVLEEVQSELNTMCEEIDLFEAELAEMGVASANSSLSLHPTVVQGKKNISQWQEMADKLRTKLSSVASEKKDALKATIQKYMDKVAKMRDALKKFLARNSKR
jgi:hypothetical protein